MLNVYRFAGTETVADVTLEDDAVAFGESEGLVGALQGRAIGNEAREDGRIGRAPEHKKKKQH